MRCSISVCLSIATILISTTLVDNVRAANISASSSGYGLDVHISALGLNLDAGPLPAGVSGVAPAPYNVADSTLNVNVTGNIPLVVGGAIGADVITGTAQSDVDGLPGVRTASATGSVVGGDIGINTLPILGGGLNLLGLDGTLSSSAQVTGDFGALVATGNTTIESLGLTISGIAVDLSAFVGVNVAPNTSVNLAVLGIANATLILNEQIISPDQSSIEVNALRLSVNLPAISANVVLGHSQAAMIAVPEPANAVLGALGFAILGTVRRRR
jgi:hypothetical protein